MKFFSTKSDPGEELEPMISEPVQDYFLSLGAGENQIPLIQAATRAGLKVIAVDRNRQAPGFSLSTIQIHCSVHRPARILRILKENLDWNRIRGVSCRSYGLASQSASVLAEVLSLPGHPFESVRLFRNKRKLKEMLFREGIPVPRIFSYRTDREKTILQKNKNPVLVRPSRGHAKQGIQVLSNPGEVREFLEAHPVDDGSFLIEPLLNEFQEITVLGVTREGEFIPVLVSEKHTGGPEAHFAEWMHVFPARIPGHTLEKIQELVQSISRIAGLGTGPLVAEFLVRPGVESSEDEIYLVEAAPEVGGEYLADIMVPTGLGMDYFEELTKLVQGKGGFQKNLAPRSAVVIRFLPGEAGTLREIRMPDNLRKDPDLLFIKELKKPGDIIQSGSGNSQRVAVFGLHCLNSDLEWTIRKSDEYSRTAEVTYES